MPVSLTHPRLLPSRSSHVHRVTQAIRAAKLLISSTPPPSLLRQPPSSGQVPLKNFFSSPASSTAGTHSRSPGPRVPKTPKKHGAPTVDPTPEPPRRRGSYPRRTRTSTC